jgi:hypothetical protein
LNEDTDDGIVVDTDESTVDDDDDANFRTPPVEFEQSTRFDAPLVIHAYCAYKDLTEALYHLNQKLIATYEPEKLRGGGLLVSFTLPLNIVLLFKFSFNRNIAIC